MLFVQKHHEHKKFRDVSLYVVSACNLSCQECIMQFMMASDRHYHMSLDEIQKLIVAATASGYHLDLTLTGGEPLLWKHLEDGLEMLRKSCIVRSILMYTNGMFPKKITKKVAESLDVIRISRYPYNEEHIRELKKEFPDKVSIMEKMEFWVNPETPVDESISLPCACLNPAVLYYKGEIFACAHSLSIASHNGSRVRLSTPIAPHFLKGIDEIRKGHEREICTMCISNDRVRKHVEKVANVSKGRSIPLKTV